jgi:Dolichyl-phosphate-mannose-protein mannosyltransferase
VPDEESHTGYVQYLAETGKVPKPGFIGYSDEENALLRALDFGSVIGVRDNRPPHGPGIDARLRAIERSRLSRVGGGDPAGAVVYPPTFYALESVPYLASPTGSSLLDRLVWMRALCALLAGLTVFLTYRFLRELLPTQPWAWTVGALGVAFLPMFGFVSGGVQNDAGMYACAAALLWAMTRVLQRGLTPLRGLAVGGALVTGILIKYTMVGLAPAAAAALLVGLWRARKARADASPADASPARRAWLGAGVAALVVALPIAAYAALSKWAWGRPLTGPLRASHPEIAHSEPSTITGQLAYAWELFLPRLPFMDDKFPGITPLWDTWYRGGIGRFG